jgi:hypothetical protein
MAASAHGEHADKAVDLAGSNAAPPEGTADVPDKGTARPRKQKEPVHA